MARRVVTALVIAGLVGIAGASGAADFEALPGLDGDELTANDLAAGAVIVVVWASWSPRCRDLVSRVNAIHRKWSQRARVATVVFQEDGEDVRHFLEGKGLEGKGLEGKGLLASVYLDRSGSFSKQQAVTTLPMLLVFQDGEVKFRGRLPVDPDSAIERALE